MIVRRASLTTEEDALLSTIHTNSVSFPQWYKTARIYYSFQLLRASVLLRVLLLCDFVCVAALWLTGSHSCTVEMSVTLYTFTRSIFDLVIISLAKWVLLLALLDCADRWALSSRVNTPSFYIPLRSKVTLAMAAFVLGTSIVYSLVKLSIILLQPNFVNLCLHYQILVILSPSVYLLECILLVWIPCTIRNQLHTAEKHIIDAQGRQLDEAGNVIEKNASLRRLFSLISYKEGTLIGGGIFCLVVTSATSIAAPYFFGKVVDAAQTSMASLNRMILILFLIYLVFGIASMFRAWLFELSGQKLVARLRVELFSAILRQDIQFFDTTRTGELTNRLSSDTEVIQSAVTVNVSMLLRNLINVVGSLVVMFWLDPALTGILLAVVPIISIGAVQYGKFVKRLRTNFQDRLADAATVAEESVSSIRTVKAFNGEIKTRRSYETEILKSYDVAKRLAMSTGIFSGWVSIAAFGAICLAMWYGGKLVFEGQLSVGILTSFLVYTVTIAANLAVISSLYGEFMQAVGASERMFNIIDKKASVVTHDPIYPESFTPLIEFRNVHFRYPSREDYEVLKGIDLTIKPGNIVALVGPSGGGKSTIVSLIERFYDCNDGQILIGRTDIRNLDPLWFRSRVSLVSQEPTLFACSIKDNIAYGTEATDQQVREAARQANAEAFIDSFPEGFDTLVGERGVRLSGGQKQRVAIARSLILQPAILLLDEATSALDAESEQLVQEAIDRATKDRTVLVIAHRLSTVRHADLVLVMDNGQIVERGTHDELVNQDGVYRRLVLKQLEAGSSSLIASCDPEFTVSEPTLPNQ